ncbi:MFS transporter [Novosphingobium sp. JCM 18896]|uniref:MFS transporter n=1 Tax=Novosphingobium sp. JCM 18896 TaxID=2989731 RepID=UPI002221A0AE|nr:MFS transporter [Novosphingobium sp. JCM 18896]MCW1430960.1 MFS transporter [Novosphingobium sp. JCM 18896]
MTDTKALARAEWRRHWPLVLAASFAFSFTSVMTASTGLFIEPWTKEFGWSRTLLSSGMSITSVTTFLFSPVFGVLIDRMGTRRMALPGLVLLAATMASLSLLDGSVWMWFAVWTVYAAAALATKSTVWTAGVASAFDAGRGLALGLTLSGSAFAQALTPPLTNWLINEFGWRMALVWLGLGWGGLAILLCAFLLFDGYDASRKARAASGEAPSSKALLADAPGLSIPEAWRSVALWRIAISTFVIMVVTIALVVHQIPILQSIGVDRTAAAYYAGMAGLAGVAGKLVTGWLLDRYPARWVGGVTLAATALTFVLLLVPNRTMPIIFTAMFINGYAAGTKLQIAGYLTSAYGGMKNFGAIFGTMASLIAAGSGLGPLLGGYVFDRYGTYDPYLWIGIVGTLISAALIFGLPDYPEWVKRPHAAGKAPQPA